MEATSRSTFQDAPHGTGGFAKIIKGRDNDLERDVAVKVLDPLATAFSEADQERFRREARILARLSHPNIPPIYDIDFSPGKFLLIFQFVGGINLRQLGFLHRSSFRIFQSWYSLKRPQFRSQNGFPVRYVYHAE